jgi:hypothetical protein
LSVSLSIDGSFFSVIGAFIVSMLQPPFLLPSSCFSSVHLPARDVRLPRRTNLQQVRL